MTRDDALEDALVRMSFRVMAVLTRIGAEHACPSPSCGCSASCATADRG